MEREEMNRESDMNEMNEMDNPMPRMPQPERLMRRERAHSVVQDDAPHDEQPESRAEGVESIGQTLRVIEMIEHKVADARRIPMSRDKCVMNSSELIDLIGQLHIALPKAVQQAQAVLSRGEQIIAAATAQADKTAD